MQLEMTTKIRILVFQIFHEPFLIKYTKTVIEKLLYVVHFSTDIQPTNHANLLLPHISQ